MAGAHRFIGGALSIGTGVLGFSDFTFSDFTFSDFTGLENGTYKHITGATSIVGSLNASNLTGTLGAGPAQGTLRFTGTDLELVVSGAPGSDPFAAWAGGPSVNFVADANNDGVDNGLAWLLGAATPNENAVNLLPDVTVVESGIKMSFNMRAESERNGAVLVLEHSSDLGITDPWTSVNVPEVNGGPTNGVTFQVTSGSSHKVVEATISSSHATGWKLYARLKAVK